MVGDVAEDVRAGPLHAGDVLRKGLVGDGVVRGPELFQVFPALVDDFVHLGVAGVGFLLFLRLLFGLFLGLLRLDGHKLLFALKQRAGAQKHQHQHRRENHKVIGLVQRGRGGIDQCRRRGDVELGGAAPADHLHGHLGVDLLGVGLLGRALLSRLLRRGCLLFGGLPGGSGPVGRRLALGLGLGLVHRRLGLLGRRRRLPAFAVAVVIIAIPRGAGGIRPARLGAAAGRRGLAGLGGVLGRAVGALLGRRLIGVAALGLARAPAQI